MNAQAVVKGHLFKDLFNSKFFHRLNDHVVK